ncbi:MAG: PrsW family glutamic-type intramembrane protease [Minisyncoccia bacterium]
MQELQLENLDSCLWALLGGIVPITFWLWFWLREDRAKPEPKALILLAFLGGIFALIASYLFEYFGSKFIIPKDSFYFAILLTPMVEEIMKFFFASFLVLNRYENDEPIDPSIYLISTALGFAAVENALFLLDPIIKGDLVISMATGNLRFIGATVLHTVSSAAIGICMGLVFYNKLFTKKIMALIGLILAIALHGGFNFLIMRGEEIDKITAFGSVWIIVIIILIIFEGIKKIKPKAHRNY